ncbi:MAG: DUF4434 domain-containing protein [Verrucomicrobia bacterium]|nr:DUF4434 domain-containing protein [Verrucomicrobiota bacterium]MCG2681259.1 DUF4434 domain-containing protein [Kiritimatiellia bacterium]MBU4246927.1 DUF4434 domain-containing protein [Verrucomicrobiota bacterium]MBU4291595.1 DUF4434 domain-containing protein [Verrucomicrobiota bacterium]MBU4428314.1 DUF4434 domain-containing protein [Verrucomicrobiota bacterium]
MLKPTITGSMIDIMHPCTADGAYWNRKTVVYTEDDWARLVRHLHRDIGLEILILQNATWNGMSLYPSKVATSQFPTVCGDPLGAILKACSAEGIKLYVGPGWFYFGPILNCFGPTTDDAFKWYMFMYRELLELYGSEPSFAGFYMSTEMGIYADGLFNPEQVAFTHRRTDALKNLAPKLPSIGVVGVCAPPQEKSEKLVQNIKDTGLSSILYTVDPLPWYTKKDDPYDKSVWEPRYKALRWAHDQTSVEFWGHPETFIFEHDIPICNRPLHPAPFVKIRAQLEMAAHYADRITCYTVPGIMTSQDGFPGLGVPETDRLYWAYKGYLESL